MSTAERPVYAQCGLRIRSDFDLHLPVATEQDGWDVDVRCAGEIRDAGVPPPGDVVAVRGSSTTNWWYWATSTGTGFRLRFRDCGEFLISADLTTVDVRRAPHERSELLPVLMAGTVAAFILTLRGTTILHASAVAIEARALAFVGPSGRGKSTVAALLCVEGADLVTDDVLAVRPTRPVTCIGGASELRLRAGATEIAHSRPDAVTRTTEDERLGLSTSQAPAEPLPLAAIVIPAPSREARVVEAQLMSPSAALTALLSTPRVFGWRRSDILSRDLATLGDVVNHVPVYGVTVPWGPPFDPFVARDLAALTRTEAATRSA